LLIHRDIFEQLTFSTVEEWIQAITSIPEQEYGWIENQAYNLAGLILVPSVPLQAMFEDSRAAAKAAGVDLNAVSEHALRFVTSNIAGHFEVSPDVIKKRLKLDNLLT
jgi:hypothetical protein